VSRLSSDALAAEGAGDHVAVLEQRRGVEAQQAVDGIVEELVNLYMRR
jgi:hypothetical protein